MSDIPQVIYGVIGTLFVSGFLWLVRTVTKTRSELDILFIKHRYVEDQLKELKDDRRRKQASVFEQDDLG